MTCLSIVITFTWWDLNEYQIKLLILHILELLRSASTWNSKLLHSSKGRFSDKNHSLGHLFFFFGYHSDKKKNGGRREIKIPELIQKVLKVWPTWCLTPKKLLINWIKYIYVLGEIFYQVKNCVGCTSWTIIHNQRSQYEWRWLTIQNA